MFARWRRVVAAAVFGVPAPFAAVAQESAARVVAPLRVFLDCSACDGDYVRTETRWAEFVRDRVVADVHVLVTELGTGAGGAEYTITTAGVSSLSARQDTLRFVSRPGDTEEETRRGLTRTIHLALAPFAARAGAAPRLRLLLDDDEADDRTAARRASDPWNSWVFEVSLDGSVEREQRQTQTQLEAQFEASRVTDGWKKGIEFEIEREHNRFELDDRTVTTTRESYGAGAVAVRSLGRHWAAGFEANLSSSSFQNTRRALRAAPAVEFSVWPYDVATSRQLTFQYSVGVSAFHYREETLFGVTRETRPTHALVAGYDVRQRWGSADATLEFSNYMDDQTQYRVEFDGSISVRIVRGLSLELGANASLLRDQLSIAARDATEEEILLELRDLRTDYQYEFSVGFSYTFGSIFNSVVNPRFGSGPGRILR